MCASSRRPYKNLRERVEQSLFREDLYYRLNVIHIELPPLRERAEDLDALIAHFIAYQNERQGGAIRGLTPQAREMLQRYHWPGNIRELQNTIERGVVLATSDVIDESVLPDRIRERSDEITQLFHSDELSIKKLSVTLERILIRRALEKTRGNRTNAAKLLEISHRALLYKIKDYALETVGMD